MSIVKNLIHEKARAKRRGKPAAEPAFLIVEIKKTRALGILSDYEAAKMESDLEAMFRDNWMYPVLKDGGTSAPMKEQEGYTNGNSIYLIVRDEQPSQVGNLARIFRQPVTATKLINPRKVKIDGFPTAARLAWEQITGKTAPPPAPVPSDEYCILSVTAEDEKKDAEFYLQEIYGNVKKLPLRTLADPATGEPERYYYVVRTRMVQKIRDKILPIDPANQQKGSAQQKDRIRYITLNNAGLKSLDEAHARASERVKTLPRTVARDPDPPLRPRNDRYRYDDDYFRPRRYWGHDR